MVRAGVVTHPSDWPFGGFHEIQEPRRKCRLIAHEHLLGLLGIASHEQLRETHAHWIKEALGQDVYSRDEKWSSSIGVGSEGFVKNLKNDLGIRAIGRKVAGEADNFVLREIGAQYTSLFGDEKEDIGLDNTALWGY